MKNADYIFLSQKWRASTLPYIGDSLEKLSQITNAKITIVGNKDIISKKSSDIIFIAYKERESENQIASLFIDKSRVNISYEIEKITQKHKCNFINMSEIICSKYNCLVTFENEIIFHDLYHLTPTGAKHLAFKLNDVILKSLDLL
ncbi:SGNH hydrolase domain-containing protein [Shewanella holmiensis]|uniref:SGNH hydrolase domain-containing protein n=1 Tax=Shewanella holmiensis TaxID=2952222 RepID=UPI003CC91DB9